MATFAFGRLLKNTHISWVLSVWLSIDCDPKNPHPENEVWIATDTLNAELSCLELVLKPHCGDPVLVDDRVAGDLCFQRKGGSKLLIDMVSNGCFKIAQIFLC